MAVAVKKYNPGFLSDQEIIDSFCVRTAEFESLVESLRESDASSSPHSLVIGPRGSGKTHLLLRVAAEVRRDPALSGLFPIVFAEESYEVTTCGELWLECLGRLAEQAPSEERDNLCLTYEDLRTVTDDQALADRCLGSLLDFADRHQTRLLLLVENLNMLFADIDDPDIGWRLRQTLQTEPRIILLGSATSRFDEIDNPEHALYDLFRVITLRPLDTGECKTLWQAVAGESSTAEAVRPLEILTGGNPRLLTIIARFGAERSFRDLMENLLDLVDEHTEYFKSHLESLPPQERRVYLALARLWKPSTTREVADLARLNTNACSAQLKRLVQRGTVAIEGGTPRRLQYYLTERLYNIYYLLRRGTGGDRFVEALIEFMICLYSPSELGGILDELYSKPHTFDIPDPPIADRLTVALVDQANSLAEGGDAVSANELYEQVVSERRPEDSRRSMDSLRAAVLNSKSLLLLENNRAREAIDDCDRLLRLFGKRSNEFLKEQVVSALWCKASALIELGGPTQAVLVLSEALAYIASADVPISRSVVAAIVQSRGHALLRAGRRDDALAAFNQVVTQLGKSWQPGLSGTLGAALLSKSHALDQMGLTISEEEFALALKCIADKGWISPGGVDGLLHFVSRTPPSVALALLEESPAADLLIPLITALQQEIGQSPRVAKEVAEVASDVRVKLTEARARHAQIRPQDSAT